MTIGKFRNHFINSLEGLYPIEELKSFFYLLAGKYLNLSRINIALQLNNELTHEEQSSFYQAADRLRNHEPIQYILGETEFFGEMGLFEKDVRSCTVKALGVVRVLTIDKKNFYESIQNDASLAYRLLEKMSNRLRDANKMINV